MPQRGAGNDNIFAPAGARSHLDAIENRIQFHVVLYAQTSEFLDQRTKSLSPRSVRKTGHVENPQIVPPDEPRFAQ